MIPEVLRNPTRADVFAWRLQRAQRVAWAVGLAYLAAVLYLTGEWSPLP